MTPGRPSRCRISQPPPLRPPTRPYHWRGERQAPDHIYIYIYTHTRYAWKRCNKLLQDDLRVGKDCFVSSLLCDLRAVARTNMAMLHSDQNPACWKESGGLMTNFTWRVPMSWQHPCMCCMTAGNCQAALFWPHLVLPTEMSRLIHSRPNEPASQTRRSTCI